MRKKLENPPAKKRILDSAQGLMLAKGYAGTSVDEVCAGAKVTKGNFFYYFKSKEALGAALLERSSRSAKDGFCHAAERGGQDPLERLYACLDSMAEMAGEADFRGCLVGTLSQECEAIGPRLRLICGKSFEERVELFRRAFQEAKKKYTPEASLDARKLADFFVSAAQGSFILMKARGGDRKVVRENLKLMKSYLKSIFGR